MAWQPIVDLYAADDATAATAPTTNHDANWAGADSAAINLNPGSSAQIFIAATSHATGTSDLQFRVLTSPDGGTNYDTTPYMSGTIGMVAVNTLHTRTVTVYGVKTFKLQFAPSLNYAWTIEGGATFPKTCYVTDGISA